MAETETTETTFAPELSVIPLRDVVIFPYMMFPLFIGRAGTIEAVDQALGDEERDKQVLLVTQKNASVDNPGPDDLHEIGTIATILKMLKLPDGKVKILVQGLARGRITDLREEGGFLEASVEPIESGDFEESVETEALVKNVQQLLQKASELGKNIPTEVMLFLNNIDDPGRLADIVVANLDIDADVAQEVLTLTDPVARLHRVLELMNKEMEVLTLQHSIMDQAKGEIDKTQRDYLLRQQLKAIQDQLGEGDEFRRDIDELKDKIAKAKMPKEVREVAEKQLRRIDTMHPESAEAGVVRTYLDWLVEMPWSKSSRDNLDLKRAQEVLDEDHYGLEKIKDRIVEYLAVRKLQKKQKGPILCLVGPPGVGKTSLGKSVARALGRKFHRISLGGVRDEAEIRGHRRTYVGALPGRIVQALRQVGTNNPVIMLDEVDKIGADFRGNPQAALLEVLDPEQNYDFRDHYLEVSVDLSKVLFITTANMLDTIHPAFLDRMEVINIPGYTQIEKQRIARRYLLPKQLRENGISEEHFALDDSALTQVIASYTKEAGLRNLERQVGTLCRKVARKVAEGEEGQTSITPEKLQEYLGPPRFVEEEPQSWHRPGIVRGLAVTGAGGDVLTVEATTMPGKGKLILTGSLGDIMKESAQAALSYVRTRADVLGIDKDVFENTDIHIHVPEGATPKDGPSAGITLGTALISAYTETLVPFEFAMTGEITLTGRVLRIGGVKEKFLAAKRSGATTVLLPKSNEADYLDMAEEYREGVTVRFMETMDDVIEAVFQDKLNLAELTP